MTRPENDLFGLSGSDKQRLIDRMRNRVEAGMTSLRSGAGKIAPSAGDVPPEFWKIEDLPGHKQLQVQATAAERFNIANPFFRLHEGVAGSTTRINGHEYINFSSYNYIGMCGHPRVNRAAQDAIDRFGTSASASRPVSGERPIHRDLERKLAECHDAEDCVVFVSGHATNVTTIGCLFGRNDLILHDSLAHNSIIQGAILSGAKRLSFPHNDWQAADRMLADSRSRFERVLIVTEGLYSMDGDIADIPRFIDLKLRHKAFLLVDEAHSLGVLGARGLGVVDHFGLSGSDIDFQMGTLSKALAGCGGYIAGRRSLVENLKYTAPGFVYSVGMSPPVAAAALEALNILTQEPERAARLRELGMLFNTLAREAGLDTGSCQGFSIVPIIVGSSVVSAKLSNRLFERGINVQPIIYPAVEERSARLRFFLNCTHTEEQIRETVATVKEELVTLKRNPVYRMV